jgi:acyl-CoA hydrolase
MSITTKAQGIRCPGRGTKRSPLECNSEALPLEATHSKRTYSSHSLHGGSVLVPFWLSLTSWVSSLRNARENRLLLSLDPLNVLSSVKTKESDNALMIIVSNEDVK